MGRKQKLKAMRKTKPSPDPTPHDRQWSSNIEIVSEEEHSKRFIWEISNFFNVDDSHIFTEYFPLGETHVRFQLLLKGKAPRQTWREYLGLHLEMNEDAFRGLEKKTSFFISSEVIIPNHVDDSLSKRKCIFHRFEVGSNSIGHGEFLSLDSLRSPQSQFLVNGTDLQVYVDVRILYEDVSMEDSIVHQENQPDSAVASSSSEARTENADGVYRGNFFWIIGNYTLFAERFKNNGVLYSPPFQFGKAHYVIHLKVQRENDEEYLSLLLDSKAVKGQETSFYCIIQVIMWNIEHRDAEIIDRCHGRLGVDAVGGISFFVGKLNLMKMSKFEDPARGYVLEDGSVRLSLSFCILKEKDSIHLNYANAKTIWSLAARQTVISSSKKKKKKEEGNALNTFTTYNWEIQNLSKMVQLAENNPIEEFKIRSKPILIEDFKIRCLFFPLGDSEQLDYILLGIENYIASNEVKDILVHCRLGIMNQIDREKSLFRELLVRLDGEFSKILDVIPSSTFYSESGGYFVNDKVKLVSDIHQVRDKLRVEKLPRLEDNQERKLITWEVDNFLRWQGFPMVEETDICSSYFEVEGFRIKLAVFLSEGLCAAVLPDPILESAGRYLSIRYRFAVSSRKSSSPTLWVDGLRNKNTTTPVALGDLDSCLKEVTGDKVCFKCEINECVEDDTA